MLKNEGHLAVAAYPVDRIRRSPGPRRTALLSLPLFPLIAFFSFASLHAQIRRTPSLAFESTSPATHFGIRLLLQFEALSSHSKPFSINNRGTFGHLLGLGRFSLLYEPFPPSFTAESCVAEIDFGLCGPNLAPFRFPKKNGRAVCGAFSLGFLFERFGCRSCVLGTRCWVLAAMGMVGFCARRA